MTARLLIASMTTLALIAGFALGRVTGPQVATAQMMPPPHFMCYQTRLATAASAAARVADQFGSMNRKFYRADMVCAPAKKRPLTFHPQQIPGPADHLICYHTQGPAINTARKFVNQLETSSFSGLMPTYFCLPTYKYPG